MHAFVASTSASPASPRVHARTLTPIAALSSPFVSSSTVHVHSGVDFNGTSYQPDPCFDTFAACPANVVFSYCSSLRSFAPLLPSLILSVRSCLSLRNVLSPRFAVPRHAFPCGENYREGIDPNPPSGSQSTVVLLAVVSFRPLLQSASILAARISSSWCS